MYVCMYVKYLHTWHAAHSTCIQDCLLVSSFPVCLIDCIYTCMHASAVLSIDSFGQPSSLSNQLETANFVLAILFVVEVLLKWTGKEKYYIPSYLFMYIYFFGATRKFT